METRKMLALEIAVISLLAMPLRGQEKEKPPQPRTALVVQVVFTEYEGEKKVSSLPYSIPVNGERNHPPTRLRMGIQVPINTELGKEPKLIYRDVGTNIDCSAVPLGEGLFEVNLNAERSSLNKGPGISAEQPLFSQFSTQFSLIMRDGQTLQATMATDPVTGRVLKIDVTLKVVK